MLYYRITNNHHTLIDQALAAEAAILGCKNHHTLWFRNQEDALAFGTRVLTRVLTEKKPGGLLMPSDHERIQEEMRSDRYDVEFRTAGAIHVNAHVNHGGILAYQDVEYRGVQMFRGQASSWFSLGHTLNTYVAGVEVREMHIL